MFKQKKHYILSAMLLAIVAATILPTGVQRVVAEDIATGAAEEENADAAASVTVSVPIYNYDIVNVVVPTSYAVAFNPYELPIRMKDGSVSSVQVVSQNYGIVNKSTRDKIVTATLKIADENGGKLVFVNSREEALNADKDTYAIYLEAVPADSSGIKVNGAEADINTSAEALADVSMNRAENCGVALQAGENQVLFKLSKAVYKFGGKEGISLDAADNADTDSMPELAGLPEDHTGATAFTFDGALNPNADWSRLSKGVSITVTYTYEDAAGNETIVNGTGAMTVK